MERQHIIIGVLFLLLVSVSGCLHDVEPVPEGTVYSGELADVTGGKTVTGVNTGGLATGTATAVFENGQYTMTATFENLPDPQGTDFYEGWVVGPSVISSGRAEKVDGVYTNTFTSDEDLTSHDFYVLTIEPDDGNPAPAKHILEGTMSPV